MTTIDTTYNGAIPSFPQVLNANIEYEGIKVLVDLSQLMVQGKISGVQTIYVDLIEHEFDVHIVMPDTQQRITAKAGTQGYYPVLCTTLMKFEITSDGNGEFAIKFINFPIAAGVWGLELKGDQGDKGDTGDAGANGTNFPLESLGAGINLFNLSDDAYKFKSIKAGANITINDQGGTLEIISTGGSGGGGGSVTPQYAGGIVFIENEIAINSDQYFSSGSYNLDTNVNNTAEIIGEFVKLNAGGIYRVDLKLILDNPLAFDKIKFFSNYEFYENNSGYGFVCDDAARFSFLIYAVPDYDGAIDWRKIKFGVSSPDAAIPNALFQFSLIKISDI